MKQETKAKLRKARIIDDHVHLSKNPETRAKKEFLLASMEKNGIDMAIALAAYFPRKSGSITNEDLLSLVEGGNNVLVFGSLNAEGGIVEGTAELENLLRDSRIVGIKLYPGYQYFYPSDKKMDPVYRLALDYSVPVMFHSGLVYRSGLMKFTHPDFVDEVAVDFPDLPIILSHLGDPYIAEAAAVVHKNPNVYLDISGLISNTTKNRDREEKWKRLGEQSARTLIAETVIDLSGTRQIIFGTDWPISSHESYLDLVGYLEEVLELNEKEKSEMLAGNIRRALGVER